jgi:hypothetical protein
MSCPSAETLLERAHNKSLQRSGTHKVRGRGRSTKSAPERWRARVLRWRRAAAELSRYTTGSTEFT